MPTINAIAKQTTMTAELSAKYFGSNIEKAKESTLVAPTFAGVDNFIKSSFGGQPALTNLVENYTEKQQSFNDELQDNMNSLKESTDKLKESTQDSTTETTNNKVETQNVAPALKPNEEDVPKVPPDVKVVDVKPNDNSAWRNYSDEYFAPEDNTTKVNTQARAEEDVPEVAPAIEPDEEDVPTVPPNVQVVDVKPNDNSAWRNYNDEYFAPEDNTTVANVQAITEEDVPEVAPAIEPDEEDVPTVPPDVQVVDVKPNDNSAWRNYAEEYFIPEESDDIAEMEAVARDTNEDTRLNSIRNFVQNYNNAISYFNENRGMSNRMAALANNFGNNAELTESLKNIGISANNQGHLSINENMLSLALNTNSDNVNALLGSEGLAGQLERGIDLANYQHDKLFPNIADYANQRQQEETESLYSASAVYATENVSRIFTAMT